MNKKYKFNWSKVHNSNVIRVYENDCFKSEIIERTWSKKENKWKILNDLKEVEKQLINNGYTREYSMLEESIKGLNTSELIGVCNSLKEQ